MIHVKTGRKVLVLLSALLGSMGLIATVAHADWKIEGANIAANKTVTATAHSELIFKVPAKNIQVLCTALTSDNLLIKPGAAAELEGKLLFTTCRTLISGAENMGCLPLEPILLSVKGKVILHESENYILMEPLAGENLGVIKYNSATCILSPENNLKGMIAFDCLALKNGVLFFKDCAVEEVTHILQQAPKALFEGQTQGGVTLPKALLVYGASEAFLEGTINTFLAAPENGKVWGGVV